MANKLIFICFFDHFIFFSCFYPDDLKGFFIHFIDSYLTNLQMIDNFVKILPLS